MFYEVEFSYSHKFSPDERAEFNAAAVVPGTFFDDGGHYGKTVIDGATLVAWAHKLPTIHRILGGKTEAVVAKLEEPVHAPPVNERCHVAVPGLGLLVIDDVINLDDCCTDRLRDFLDDGWRIIAVCVQPDTRRPDYILGRTKVRT